MQKTLGGDRLGSGKRMKVELHNYERSTHDLGFLFRSSMSAGTLVPFLDEIALPGDTFDIDLESIIKTHPTIGPLFGSYKVQLDIFQAPIRLYHSALHNNALNIGRNMSTVKLPKIELKAYTADPDLINDIDNCQVNPSCLLSYLGIRGVGWNEGELDVDRKFNALSILAYWDIYKNYYANKQEEKGAVIHTPSQTLVTTPDSLTVKPLLGAGTAVPFYPATGIVPAEGGHYIRIGYPIAPTPIPSQIYINVQNLGWISAEELATDWVDLGAGTGIQGKYNAVKWGTQTFLSWRLAVSTDAYNGSPTIYLFPLTDIDEMRTAILNSPPTAEFDITADALEPYVFLTQAPDDFPNIMKTQEGLAVKTYQSDLFNNWLSTDWIDGAGGISEVTSIDTTGGSFTIDTLILSRKVYNMLNRIAVSGGSYYDWLDAVYTETRIDRCESPMYMGGLIKELVFQEVVSNSESESEASGTQPLGTLAGKGIMSNKHKGGKVIVKVDEPSIILGLISLTPRIDYSQGNKWHVHLNTMDDLHKPALDEIGFQELITEQMAWWDTEAIAGVWTQKSAGKQPAWVNYMTNVNKTFGSFAIRDNEMFMTLNRRYEKGATGIDDLTTYIDPTKYNFIFANTALDAQNFWTQIAVDITARRKMSAKLMPNL